MSFPAFFDTCTLYGSVLNDFLLRLAEGGAFRPLWSEDIMIELQRNLVANGLSETAVDRRLKAMRSAFPDAMVEGYKDLIPGMSCDPKDRHVLAAAVRANAELLVTFNVKDFPIDSIADFDIGVVHPDDFLLDQLDLYPGLTIRCIRDLARDYGAPTVSVYELLQWLTNAGVPKFTQEVTTRFLA